VQEAEQLMAEYGEAWKKRYGCLDGLSSRPSVQECVEQALNHSARHKNTDLRVYVEGWLSKATKDWVRAYFHEQSAAPTDPGLSPEAVERKLKAEQERKAKYQQQRAPKAELKPFSEPLDWNWAREQLRGRRSGLRSGQPVQPESQS